MSPRIIIGKKGRTPKKSRKKGKFAQVVVIAAKGHRISYIRKIALARQYVVCETVLAPRSSNGSEGNIRKGRTYSSGAQTAKLAKMKQVCAILQEFETDQEFDQIPGGAGHIEIRSIRSLYMVQ